MQYRKPGSLVLLACILIGCGSEEPAVTDSQADSPQPATLSAVAPAVNTAPVSNTINIGVIERIESAILGEERELWIYLPESADDPANIAQYPVVYLLDGQGHFHSVTGLIQQLSSVNGITLDNVREDTNPQTNHIRSILQFVDSAEASIANNKLSFASKYYENDNHGSVPLIAEYDALRWQFDWYSPSAAISDHYNPALPDAPDEVVRLVEAHYGMLSQRFGYEFTPPFGWVNARANDFVFSEKPESARALYLMNVANYSGDGRVHAALADYFVGVGDEASARIHFGRAVGLGLDVDVEERLGGGE